MNTRPRRVGGAARGPWRAPLPAVAGVHAVCARASRIWGGLGPFALTVTFDSEGPGEAGQA